MTTPQPTPGIFRRKHKLPSAEEVLRVIELRGDGLYWRDRPGSDFISQRAARTWATRYEGRQVGVHFNTAGYQVLKVLGVAVYFHRVVWLLHHGCWPTGLIDHINGIKHDNRIENLRDVSQSENMRNAALNSRNRSGVSGVSFHRAQNLWRVRGWKNGKDTFLGYFPDKASAIEVRRKFEREHGYTTRHGSNPAGAA